MNDMISPTESHMKKKPESLNRAVRIIIHSQVTQPSVNVLLNSLHLNGHTKDFKLYNSYSKIIKATLRTVLLNRRLMNVSTLERYNLLLQGNKWCHKNERTAFNWVIIDRKKLAESRVYSKFGNGSSYHWRRIWTASCPFSHQNNRHTETLL